MSSNLIIGAGAIGTTFAAYLTAARREVRVAVLENELDVFAHAEHLRVDRITGRPPLIVPKPQLTTSAQPRSGDNVFICVKHRDFPALLDSWPDQLPDGVTLIPCLNGVGASRELEQRYPNSDIAALTIMFNAQLLAPLHARVTARPQVLLNTEDRDLLGLFGRSGVDVRRSAGRSEAWGKLLINLANAICALTNTTFKDLLTRKDLIECFIAVLDEAVEVLQRAGIHYQLPVALPYGFYRLMLRYASPIPWWVGRLRNNMGAGSYPSMVADLRRGHTTEVRQLNGEIVHLADSLNMPAPLNLKLMQMIEEREGHPQHAFMSPSELRSCLCHSAR